MASAAASRTKQDTAGQAVAAVNGFYKLQAVFRIKKKKKVHM